MCSVFFVFFERKRGRERKKEEIREEIADDDCEMF